ncbi:MAG: sulfide/dihydroorotate dehydrogenase-like FAD/NAD-binding protein [Cyclobacteriaceae bacterium]|nr:sulfide/dihydroorotate dehydrogenase-like FAD/NAD-binding protein [Cyclobacteriaceae bacterium]
MTERVEHIIKHIHFDSEVEVGKALDHAEELTDLTPEEKNDLAEAFSIIFYHHDHAGVTAMVKMALRAEHLLAGFGCDVVPFLIQELVNADEESAGYLGRAIALNPCHDIDLLLEEWENKTDDDFAIINIIQTFSYFKSKNIIKAMPQILVAAKSGNLQVRAIALYTIGKLAISLKPDSFSAELRMSMFDVAFEMLSDRKPLVRRNAARALGKMQKKGLLLEGQKRKTYAAFKAILGIDGNHNWDRAFIVRHEANYFIPLFKSSPVSGSRYNQSFTVLKKKELCAKTFHFVIEAPLIARKLQPGQFIIVRPHAFSERIPLSICGRDAGKGTIEIIVNTVGKTSGEINALQEGDHFVDIVGPLGKPSHIDKYPATCVVIGGGYGTGAIIPTARDLKKLGNRVVGIVGARSKDLLLMIERLHEVCDEVLITTNDGSRGIAGFVTDALQQLMEQESVGYVLAIGPVPMMKAVSDMTRPHAIETYVSLNATMVDGTGMCGACRVSVGGKTKFACFHGPDFNGHDVDFEQLMQRQKMFVREEKEALAGAEL